ncbi:MAG TPA: twin-arginine translocase TatA/TatE family subunit [Pyrinomonadaceae bacterium]|nr:twin-arginine translocase TatA/TatE family subunit [Pyrinomonadaceae bacterium]
MFALILESLSSTELLFILVIALIFFGPRKLPQLARSMGKGLAEFRKASDDFKRTWEREVALEAAKLDLETENSILPPAETSFLDPEVMTEPLVQSADPELVVARGSEPQRQPEPLEQTAEPLTAAEPLAATAAESATAATPEPLRKQEWI